MPLVVLLFKKYWVQLGIVLGILAILFGVYLKGRSDAHSAMEKAANKEYAKRWDNYVEERRKNERLHEHINNDRSERPINDARDSCLLSNDPLSVDCL